MPGIRLARASLLLPLLLAALSCATLRVPDSAPSFKTEQFARTEKSGLILEAHAVAALEEYWELFEDNLPDIGIAALWIRIRNDRAGPVSPRIGRWRLVSPGGKYRPLGADELFDRYYDLRGIRAFSVHADQQARERLQPLLFDGGSPLRPSETRSGFVFFRTPPARSAAWVKDARLVLRGLRLADRESVTLELPLNYASP
jgi:hypothetical protein